MADIYANYAQLAADKSINTDYIITWRNIPAGRGAHIAIHGGSIEAPTTQLADYCAATSAASYYSFQGIMSTGNSALHITSTHFDEPTVFQILRSVEWTISWHGTSSSESVTYLGGLDTDLMEAIHTRLTAAGFAVSEAPQEIDGNDAANIANRNLRGQGVQLELSRGLRESFYRGGDLTQVSIADETRRTSAFYSYTAAVMAAIADKYPLSSSGAIDTTPVYGAGSTGTAPSTTSVAGYPGAGILQMRMPFQLDSMGRVAVLTDTDTMRVQRTRGVVATVPGEYIGEPAFGSNISRALFRPSDPVAPAVINDAVRSAVARWEPDVVITSISPVIRDDQEGIVDVEVDIALTNTPTGETERTENVRIMPGGRVIGSSL
ncbi:poly-gamma-glutamate hydrolase family protein [Streptomyces sp. BH105]|uniref:poly-gamma-glutamate hydrolase family protein n=1 Tax=Streptomyces sp. BH105 TaxID=3410408 RepID=UPI003CEF9C25